MALMTDDEMATRIASDELGYYPEQYHSAMEMARWKNELLNAAADYIIELVDGDDFICEAMNAADPDYCSENCRNVNRECVFRFLNTKIKKTLAVSK